MILHLFTWYHGRPVSSLLYDSTDKNTLLPQLNQPFQDTETRIKNYIPTSGKIALHHTPKYSHSITVEVLKLEWIILPVMGLTFYKINNKQDAGQFTVISVPLIHKLMELPTKEDQSCACPSSMPDEHVLIEADCPKSKEDGSHVVIPCLYHLTHFPRLINIGWGVSVIEP